jgi:hypothetical protein
VVSEDFQGFRDYAIKILIQHLALGALLLRASPGPTPIAGKIIAVTHLDGFKGVLQVDGYAGYRRLAERGDVQPRSAGSMCGVTSTSSRLPVLGRLPAKCFSALLHCMRSRRTSERRTKVNPSKTRRYCKKLGVAKTRGV